MVHDSEESVHIRPTDRRVIRRHVPGLVLVTVVAALLPAFVGPVWGQTLRRGTAPVRRATPPSGPWGRAIEATFFDDAFTSLVGPRPDFSRPAGPVPRPGPGGDGTAPAGDGFRWSALVSEETLTDEIKDMKETLAAACATPSAFKGGGYDKARRGFSTLALAFSVIAAYDGGIRWQKDATTARDLFARAGFNCKVGTDQSFAEAKARLEDLDRLLQGSSPEGRPEREEDFVWSQVAGRPALMGRLEDAQGALRPAAASAADFNRHLATALHAAEIVAVIGEVIQRRDYEYHDDDSYRAHCVEMRDAAGALRKACQDKDYEAARAAAGRIEKACNACHGDYRG